jgi:hypothetical protein
MPPQSDPSASDVTGMPGRIRSTDNVFFSRDLVLELICKRYRRSASFNTTGHFANDIWRIKLYNMEFILMWPSDKRFRVFGIE